MSMLRFPFGWPQISQLRSGVAREVEHGGNSLAAHSTFWFRVQERVMDWAMSPAGMALWRTWNYFHRPTVYLGNQMLLTRTNFGHLLYLDSQDCDLTPNLCTAGCWEINITRLIRRYLRRGGGFIDVGANIGYHAIMAAARVGGRGRVFAFEPNPRACDLLCRSVKANGFAHLTVVNQAVADQVGPVVIHCLTQSLGSSCLNGSLEAEAWAVSAQPYDVSVAATSLDEYFQDEDRPIDLIKIDVEGAEPRVWRGMPRLLARNPRVKIIMEFFPAKLRQGNVDPEQFLAELRSSGFQVHRIDCHGNHAPASNRMLLDCAICDLLLWRS